VEKDRGLFLVAFLNYSGKVFRELRQRRVL